MIQFTFHFVLQLRLKFLYRYDLLFPVLVFEVAGVVNRIDESHLSFSQKKLAGASFAERSGYNLFYFYLNHVEYKVIYLFFTNKFGYAQQFGK